MDDALQICFATDADARTLADFNIAMALETEHKRLEPQVVLAGVKSLLARPEAGFYLVARWQGEVAGSLMVTFEWSDWRNGQFWWIQSVYVHPKRRRRGVFRGLYTEVKTLAQHHGNVCGLRLYVERDNQVAQQTYQQIGMNETPYRILEQEFDVAADNERSPGVRHDQ
jgi:ribosomal protein S18 acetylase RimI-like enzyme